MRLRSEVQDTLDQNELLEFRILELEVRESVLLPQQQTGTAKPDSCLHKLHTWIHFKPYTHKTGTEFCFHVVIDICIHILNVFCLFACFFVLRTVYLYYYCFVNYKFYWNKMYLNETPHYYFWLHFLHVFLFVYTQKCTIVYWSCQLFSYQIMIYPNTYVYCTLFVCLYNLIHLLWGVEYFCVIMVKYLWEVI